MVAWPAEKGGVMTYTINNKDKWVIIPFQNVVDDRGSLTVMQEGRDCPFHMRRLFMVYNVPTGVKRGGHAHHESLQIHFCLGGTAKISLDDGRKKAEIILDSPNKGLFVQPLVWSEFELSSPQTSLVVASSDAYDEKDYIRDYKKFLKLVR